MENKLLKELYDCFYIRPELDEQENEVEKCHKALIAALEKPERRLVLRIIDAQDSIREQTYLDSFMAGRTLSENRPPSTVLWLALNWRGGSRRNCTTTKTSAHSPVGPGEWVLVSYLMRNRNEEQIDIAVAITTSLALWAAVSPQNTTGKKTVQHLQCSCFRRYQKQLHCRNRHMG